MPFDQTTRNRLARFVGEARALLSEEFTRQLQAEYGLDPQRGEAAEIERLAGLDDARRETARLLRGALAHYTSGEGGQTARARQAALQRIVREQAFSVLNRLCALRMAEARGLLVESVGRGYAARGFQLYARLAGAGLGETGAAYRQYLFSLFDELALDLPALFDRFSPQGRLFPGEAALLRLLGALNDPELEPLWAEDETIGWIYQYFNSKEERQQMRAASQAPRDSRELAVRNQFFTPRYVVEFLTDNTLGRTWYEMTQGKTGLAEACRYLVRRPNEVFLGPGESAPQQDEGADLSQEELLRRPVYIPHRPLKDPREIRLLDPACGSMHFGLYAFDLFEQIYAEAWELEERLGADALQHLGDLEPLHAAYPDRAALLRDAPRLIIERNLHGIDIDPRAVQIAGLSLWLRAQKSWQAQSLRPSERPTVTRSNVVCAEPMPGEGDLLDEFAAGLTPKVLGPLVRSVFEKMKLAGEAGSLLKIEEEMRSALDAARREYNDWLLAEKKGAGYLPGMAPARPTSLFEWADLPDAESFWPQAEARLLEALRAYAESAQNGRGYQKRLFAADAARGFAFIDLCRKRYDVVVMNPPFGEPIKTSREALSKHYPNTKHDLFAAFCERALQLITFDGIIGEISSRVGFFLKSFENWRKDLLSSARLISILDLGSGVLDDATVEAACYVVDKKIVNPDKNIVVFRLLLDENKSAALDYCVKDLPVKDVFFVSLRQFSSYLPFQPFVYWISPAILKKFSQLPSFEPNMGVVRQGLGTGDNNRFIRAIWEVPPQLIGSFPNNLSNGFRHLFSGQYRWAFHVRSGSSQPWYSPLTLVIDWENQGTRLKEHWISKGESPSRYIPSEDLYFRTGFSWTLRAFRFIPYLIPSGCIPSASRYMAFPIGAKEIDSIGLCASNTATAFMRIYGEMFERPKHLVDTLKRLPIVELEDEIKQELLAVIQNEVSKRRKFYRNYEPYSDFLLPAKIKKWVNEDAAEWNPYSFLGTELEQKIAHAYGISNTQLQELIFDLEEAIQIRRRKSQVHDAKSVAEEDEEKSDVDCDVSEHGHTIDLISYLEGCVFGRWDIRYATGERQPPELPDPFAALPSCPPGMLQNAAGLPAAPHDVPAGYPLRIAWPGILVDDPGHPEDVLRRVEEALQVIWPERWEAIEAEAAAILGVAALRDYFRRSFFADHLARYSKSRRQAPIYWPLSTPSGSYTLWLYYPRLDDQILYTCVNDFVEPKLKQVAEETARLRRKTGRSRPDEKELERLAGLEGELKDLRAELLRAAAFWKPDLNDGVQISAAPLWRLFQHRPWQKKLKETWEKLEGQEYEWAHLAYAIWPERVRAKCRTDKSLAIAHGVEYLYEEPKGAGKKPRKKAATGEMEDMFDG